MEMKNKNIDFSELVQTIHGETAAETEIILPDYLPSVLKLVKTEAVPYIRSRLIRADRIFVEGAVEFRVLYMPENDGGLQCVTHQVPFSYSTEMKAPAESSRIEVTARIAYANTRALSPQKLYVKATAEVSVFVYSPANIGVTVPECDGTEFKSKPFTLSDAVGGTQKILKISDEIEAEPGTVFGRILRYDAAFTDSDRKILTNKVIVKANMLLTVVYIDGQTNKICVCKLKLPISQVLEMRDITEDTVCDVCFTVSDCRMNIKESADGKSSVEYDIEISISMECHRDICLNVPVDAFLLGRKSECSKKTVSFQNIMQINDTFDIDETVTPEEAEQIYDIAVSPAVMSVLYDTESKAVVSQGVFNCNILYKTVQGDTVSVDKALPFMLKTPVSDTPAALKSNTRLTVTSLNYSFDSGSVNLHLTGEYTGNLIFRTDVAEVCGVEPSEDIEPTRPELILYYASDGDNVWEIAKKYCASPSLIMKNNGLISESIPESKMIFI